MPAYDEMRVRNEAFVAAHDPTSLPDAPRLGALVVSCIDFRVDPAHYARLGLGEAFVLRVLGGRVTEDVEAQVVATDALARLHGEALAEVVVVHHTDCGTAAFAERSLAESVAPRVGMAVEALQAIAVDDPRRTVAEDVARLTDHPALDAEVKGFVYDLANGRLSPVP